jgi:DNA polymerase-3 subunit gamma/tau
VHGHFSDDVNYQVLARKYRPTRFDDVVGQDAITRTLRNALASGRIAHAYLFAGPRGIGKTTTARLLAKALLCPDRRDAEPCGRCAVCGDAAGTVDVIEIDGASNRGIEEIRTLRENVKYAPARGRFKVYIIDEVHQLTEAAFNALLKTLEEPPAHVVFVLATTDPRDIPATVLSRVQRFDFRPIAPDQLTKTLEGILEKEKIAFEPAALPAIVRAAEGSLRDALSLLDTAIAYGNGRLEADTTAALLGTTSPAEVRAFARALVGHESTPALEAIDRAAREGEDLGAFTRDVIELLRRSLVLKAAPAVKLADVPHVEANELRALGEAASLDDLLYVLRAFLDADAAMRDSPHPRVELEIAAVRATRRPQPRALEDVLKRVEEAETRLRQGGVAAPVAPRPQENLLPSSESGGRVPSEARRVPAQSERPTSPTSTGGPAPAAAARVTPRAADTGLPSGGHAADSAAAAAAPPSADVAAGWQRVIDDVMRRKPTLGAVLSQTRPSGLRERELQVVLTGNSFHREMLADSANRDLVSQAVRRHVAGADRFGVVTEDEGGGGAITDHPAVQAAVSEFQGEVVAVRPRLPEGEGQ